MPAEGIVAPLTADIRRVRDVLAWLVRGALSDVEATTVLDLLCARLTACGLPLWRAAVFVRTLHPDIMGRRFLWQEGEEVKISTASFEILDQPEFLASPVVHVYQTGENLRLTPGNAEQTARFPVLAELHEEGATDYLATPLIFSNGEIHVATWTTRRPGGFDREDIANLDAIAQTFARIAEAYALRRTATILLDTYLGKQSGARVMSGQIRRGHSETMHGVVWLSDMRGFTRRADSLAPEMLLDLLNRYFDCQVAPIVEHGGEVLKFMGDGLLAIFPAEDSGASAARACREALQAVKEVEQRFAALNVELVEKGGEALHYGIALHVGAFLYGNIGGGGRLDFTCIGPAINLAARLEKLTGRLQRSLVVSRDFAAHDLGQFTRLGEFELPGFGLPQEVFGLG